MNPIGFPLMDGAYRPRPEFVYPAVVDFTQTSLMSYIGCMITPPGVLFENLLKFSFFSI